MKYTAIIVCAHCGTRIICVHYGTKPPLGSYPLFTGTICKGCNKPLVPKESSEINR